MTEKVKNKLGDKMNEEIAKITNIEEALNEWEAYQTFTERLLDDSDYQKIGGRSFKKKIISIKQEECFLKIIR